MNVPTVRQTLLAVLGAGWCLAAASAGAQSVRGDFNGDGFDDLAIGAPREDVGAATDAGAVNVLYGGPGGLQIAGNQLLVENLCANSEPSDHFGAALAAGDFNGDGFTDLAVGMPDETVDGLAGQQLVFHAGAVLVFHGSGLGLGCAGIPQFWHQNVPGVQGEADTEGHFGFALAAGNFDGDAFADLAIGVPGDDGAGAVNVLYGTAAGLQVGGNQRWSQATGGIPGASQSGDQFGFALAAGNFDGFQGDPFDDLAVGVPGEDLGLIQQKDDAGAVIVIYGSPAGLASAGSQFWDQSTGDVFGNVADGPEQGDRFGAALAAGDFNVDDADDLAIGAPGEDVPLDSGGEVVDAGAVNVLYGNAARGLVTLGNQFLHQNFADAFHPLPNAAQPDDQFGFALLAADFNGGGAADLAIAVPNERINGQDRAGAVHVISGSAQFGLTTLFANQFFHQDVTDSNGVAILDQAEANDRFGVTLAAGNFNGEVRPDDGSPLLALAIGTPHESVLGRSLAGAVNVIYSTPVGLVAPGNQFFHQGKQDSAGNVVKGLLEAGDQFGAALR